MAHPEFIPQYRRWLAGALAVLMGLGPLATPAYAAATALADQPLGIQNQAKPNIILTVDDSTSMLFDYLPDGVIGKYCRDMTGNMNAACGTGGQNTDLTGVGRGKYVTPGYVFEQAGAPFGPTGAPNLSTSNLYSASGPGAGCITAPLTSATCFGGIAPGALPGLETYPNPLGPPPAKSPKAGQPYEYWTLWPAPAHNSELNHVYYNPRQQYDPPIDRAGNPFPRMNAGNTTGWTRVPADPFATSPQLVDLTAPVTIGLWCNSDWSVGNETDPAYCRTNGTGDSLNGLPGNSSKSSADGDYNYPWAPPGINPDLNPPNLAGGPTIAKSIAWSKVDTASGNALKPAWVAHNASFSKFYYENDNILWCDATSTLWPRGGPPIPQTCIGGSFTPQTCLGRTDQTCSPGTPQTCDGPPSETCINQTPQTCGPLVDQVCTGTTAQTCVAPAAQTCDGIGTQTCVGVAPQTCDNVIPQTCVNITGQSCDNTRPQTCNLAAPACVPPDPATCVPVWIPPGICPPDPLDPEPPTCTLDPGCPPSRCSSDSSICTTAATCPVTGTCSINTGTGCTALNAAVNCPTLPGTCSRDGVTACLIAATCPVIGNCSVNTLQSCTVANAAVNCPTIPGHCSTNTLQSCMTTPECVDAGHCNITGAVCPPDTCPDQNGLCTITRNPCFGQAACDRPNTCSGTGAICTTPGVDPLCPPVGGTCSIDLVSCTGVGPGTCGQASTCNLTGAACHTPGPNPIECPPLPGNCNVTTAQSCTVDANCPTPARTCSSTGFPCTTTCPNLGQNCSVTGEACSTTPYFPICSDVDWVSTCSEPSFCKIQGGTCSVSGLACNNFYLNFWPFFAYDVGYCNAILTPGHCSVDTATVCYGDPWCSPTPGPSGSATCSDKLSDNSRSLLEDANGAGVVCRHNNNTGSYVSGRYTYPNAQYNTPVTAGTGPNACVASPRYAAVPRHYWKTGLEWCDFQVTTPGDKWLGYGRITAGTCQDSQDATHIWPRFYQFGQAPGTDNYATPAFQRMDLIPGATYTHNFTDDGGPETIVRTYAGTLPDDSDSEMTNYANWFAYYRTRIQAVKTVTSASFNELDAKYRVGFHTMFQLSSFLNIADFDTTQKPNWFDKLFGVTIPLGQETPTLTAIARIGDYFLNGTHPDLTGSSDPIQLSCQQNFHLLFTDGITNQSVASMPIAIGNVDGSNVPAAPWLIANPIIGLAPGVPWPRPYREGTLGASNSLSDYALHYWFTDLRPGMPDNVPTTNTPPQAGDRYSAKWQNLRFAALSLGTAGKLPSTNQTATEADLRSPIGTLEWPRPIPSVNKPDASGVDDLWHAAMNGHGDFVNADSIEEVKLGIGKILSGLANLPGTRTSVGFVSNTFGASANFLYRVRFEEGWSGSVAKIQINPITGIPLVMPPIWDAAAKLETRVTPSGLDPQPWFSKRRIITMNQSSPGTPVPFLWGSLGAGQKESLAPGKPDPRRMLVLEFLRGSHQKEGVKVGQFRSRTTPLGDIVDSSPVYLGIPNAPYLDATDPGYAAFKSGAAGSRPAQIYVGANDGMLHAFDDLTGNETWAYVPTPLYRGGSRTGGGGQQFPCYSFANGVCDSRASLAALAYQNGALPPFRHHYYVNLTPKIGDVDFNAPAGDDWRTLLVGGLGKGGNRYFALDVTIPPAVAATEASVASKALWEFPPVGNTLIDMGFTYGKPVIHKTRALFGGAWLVTVASGYNNPSGIGKLYFLQASNPNPANYKVMSTGVGSVGTPAGLAHPAGYTQDFHNQLAEQFYVGDLLGNFWRFDVSDALDAASWSVGQYAQLTAPGGGGNQPVTTPPEIKIDPNNGVDRWVFVGTGKLYDESDLAIAQRQTMYALRDGTAVAPWPLPATPIDRTTPGMVMIDVTDVANNFGLATVPDKGWFHDLPAGSRIVVAPQAAFGIVAYIATRAQDDPCLTGLPVTVYARQYGNGQSVLTVNPDGTGAIIPGIDVDSGVGLQIVTFQPDGSGSSTPDIRLAITMADGTVRYFKPKPSAFLLQHRMSWRLLGQ